MLIFVENIKQMGELKLQPYSITEYFEKYQADELRCEYFDGEIVAKLPRVYVMFAFCTDSVLSPMG